MNLSVIIASYNTKDVTISCLRSLDKFPYREKFEVIIVDNASSDGSVEEIRRYKPRNYSLKLIKSPTNVGFSKANNAGIKAAKGNHILLLNSDTEVLKDSLNILMDFAMDHKEAGIIAPRLLNVDRSIQPSVFRLPTLTGAVRQYWLGEKGLEDKYAPDGAGPVAVEAAVAAAFLITPQGRKKAGLLNEAYFMYFEDLDYCREMVKAGLKIYYVPEARILHLHGRSGEKVTPDKDQWRRLIPGSKIYHGLLIHYLRWAVIKSSQKPEIVILPLIILLALILRMLWFRDNFFFGFEQGRDFIKLTEIASGNLTLIGPKTDINGIFHGALSYYVLFLFFVIFSGNPYLVAVSLIFLHVFSIYFLYKFAREFIDAKYAYFVVLLYSVSYTSIIYNRWLSNPNLVPALTIFVLYFLQKAQKQKYYLVVVAIFWAIIFHLQVIAAMVLFLPIAYIVLSGKIITLKNTLLSLGAVFLVLSSYLLFNYKNDNILFNGIKNYLTSDERQSFQSVRLDELFNETVDNFFPDNRIVAYILFWAVMLVSFWHARKNPKSRQLLILYLAAPVLFLVAKTSPLRHLFILNSLFVSLLFAYIIRILNKNGMYVLSLILLSLYLTGNIAAVFSRLPNSNRNFIYHAQSTYLSDEINLLDYVYSESGGERFSYNYYTVPYWQPAAWEYLFKWYGEEKFGYLPAEGQTEVFYVLYEPDETQPKYQEDWYKRLNETSRVLESFESGKLKAEKRRQI